MQLTPLINDRQQLISSLDRFENVKREFTNYEVSLPQIHKMIKQEAGRNNNSTLLLITDGVRGLRLENELWPIPVNLCNAIKNDGIKLLVVE